MLKAILGKKVGMTQIFEENGEMIPVTVVEAGPCVVVQKKTVDSDGYEAIQLGYGEIRESLVNKPVAGTFKKAGLTVKRYLREFKTNEVNNYEVGQEILADVFEKGELVDVTGISKGKGYAGAIKRWNHHRSPMTHGVTRSHRKGGSMGTRTGKTRKGTKRSGHLGNEKVTIQNLTVAGVMLERNLLLVKGSIPGKNGSMVIVKKSVKA
ncbi:MAG: 50S ribosomal protein L3 [Clostridiales bacterium]|nr:50S ribosomal protein L3 [Clostridiales bacterium]MBP3940261.1 50S ribosomal protein L3 [Christensenellaceae bacterium]MBR3843484.1 50S ribosomal protein L3 [Christensenellaceae bacterium]